MKIKNRIQLYLYTAIGIVLFHTTGCENDEIKKDPVISWTNPDDITYGRLLSETQLNATADVSGTFVYTPAIGTKLNEGDNQDLKVDFAPADSKKYNFVSKTVTINVIAQPTLTDIDGNIYHTVTIGTQKWMVENLRTTKYNDGNTIPNVTDTATWSNLTTPAYCWYNNDAASNKATYGALYNWYTVNTGKLCPTGWHIPTDAEWSTLIDYIGGEAIAGGKLKETGNTHWNNSNYGATNEFGFTALPSGALWYNQSFYYIGFYGAWWSSSEDNTTYAWYRCIYSDFSNVIRNSYYKSDGISIRCVMD